jgi:hypothetical protein
MKPYTFLDKFKKIAETEGFTSLEEFVNEWVQNGGTFSSLQEWLMLNYSMEYCMATVWRILRNYLTIPYTHEDQFWYKWNAIAKAKGFKDPKHMIERLRKRKLCKEEIAEELGVIPSALNPIVKRLVQDRIEGHIVPKRKYERKKFKITQDKNGISFKKSRGRWREQLKKHGFRSLRDAIWRMKKKGLNYIQMAEVMEVSIRGFRYRRRRAGL